MIKPSTAYKLVNAEGVVIAAGSAKAMHKLRKATPGSRVWITSTPVGSKVATHVLTGIDMVNRSIASLGKR